jgi:hypothetical protein
MASGLGGKRRFVSKDRISLDGLPRSCGSLFLDSGAHSLFNLHVLNSKKKDPYRFYRTYGFKKYLDNYAKFVKKYRKGIDFYVNVDAIFNPELSWRALKYLEREHGLKPVPVIHDGTPLMWVEKHLEAGYKFIGIGGLGQTSTKQTYMEWADRVFDLICSTRDRMPLVRTHGFAMTSHSLMRRYPWWSVDSSSWAKAAGNSTIYVPHFRNERFVFDIAPHIVSFNWRPEDTGAVSKNCYDRLGPLAKKIVNKWLMQIDVPLGSVDDKGEAVEYGVASQYNARAIANLRYFERFCQSLPHLPWPFNIRPQKGFFE